MDEAIDRELEAILKLIKLTQDGALKWHAAKAWGDLVENETTRYTDIYFCEYMDKRLRIFTEKKRIDSASEINQLSTLAGFGMKYPYWQGKMVLEITNQSGQSLWRFPYKSALSDLFSAVKYQVAGVKEVIDNLLSN